jgi:transcription-repair coupling factor (superfamily II helicase)
MESILVRELELGHKNIKVVGTDSPAAIALCLSNSSSNDFSSLPHVVVVPSLKHAYQISQGLSFFNADLQCEILEPFDVSPYSGLYPSQQLVAERLRFLFRAQNAKPGSVCILPVGSLLQKTISFEVLKKNTYSFSKNDDLPAPFSSFLNRLGYSSAPIVEDIGQYSVRGGIIDVFSPAQIYPVRIELFGDTIESLRHFSISDQRSVEEIAQFSLIPCREFVWDEQNTESAVEKFREYIGDRKVDKSELEETLRSLTRHNTFPGIDFLTSVLNKKAVSVLDHFSSDFYLWMLDPISIEREADDLAANLKSEFEAAKENVIRPPVSDFVFSYDEFKFPDPAARLEFISIDTEELSAESKSFDVVPYTTRAVLDLSNALSVQLPGTESWIATLKNKLTAWKSDSFAIFIGVKNKSQSERLKHFLDRMDWSAEIVSTEEGHWNHWVEQQSTKQNFIHIIPRVLPESIRFDEEKIILLRDEDLLGKKQRLRSTTAVQEFNEQARRLNFGDLKPGDCIVHVLHGIGIYEGLKIMNIGGAESEFIQVAYKDKDKLYLPVYRIGQLQKYSGSAQTTILDKLGGTQWEKTKSKVKGHLRDLANDLLQLYAQRAQLHRPQFRVDENNFENFEAAFPYDETDDQVRAINDLIKDLSSTKPMDRLICGDVGYGKTEVAMRAAFIAAIEGRQVAVLAPTTVLTFQHLETFKKRFKDWPIEIRALNRFISNADAKKTLKELADGKVQILIGTHRILSKDVVFKDLGLLIVDEEQKFGVAHKERIRKMRASVDTLAMSATPIPRTLNMSLFGIRDLSIINTAPVDRLPTRTFITKWDEETIRKSIDSEIARGGQVYFIHNRIQSIYGVADEVRKLVPQARIKVAHGQMPEHELEAAMIQFFNHEIDVLICTAIVESGMDVSRANTMFIDQAHMMGLSQLYQLRGRVGRSKQRAYCFLILPRGKQLDKQAQERLKVIQENTALGSGIKIAQYDLELRGAGNILGEEQSGHIDSVGYEMYMELLNEAIHEARGEPYDKDMIEPEINLRIPALIPEAYISDIRIRLSYYKALADIKSHEDLEKIENELKDQFGEIPEPALNLMGLMLIRSQCKELGVRDLSAGVKNVSLIFTPKTPLSTDTIIKLAMRENKKYSVTPDSRLNIRMNTITWPAIFEELTYLLKLIV